MKQIEINLGKACNNDCVFCANGTIPPDQRRFLSLETIENELEQAASDGFRALGFLGGEATLFPDFPEVLRSARKKGFERICLTTNGRKLKDHLLLSELVTAGVTRITLSIHSHVPEVENRICGRANAFDDKIQAIRNIVQSMRTGRIRLADGFALNACIHGLNVRHLTSLAAFFRKLGVTDIRFNYVMPEHRAVDDPRWIPRISSLGPALQQLAFWNESEGGMRLTVSDVPLCAYPEPFRRNQHLWERYLGEAWDLDTFVTMFGGSDSTKDHFRWKERRQNRLKAYAPCCRNCAAVTACEGAWKKYLEIHGDSDLKPIGCAGQSVPGEANHE